MARLNKQQKIFLCQKIAERRTWDQIVRCFKETYDLRLYKSQIKYFKESETWKKEIEYWREQFDKAISDLAMSSKRNRLEFLQKAYDEAEKGTITRRYGKDGELISETETPNPAGMVAAVRQAHEEVEGKSLKHKIKGKMKGETKYIISYIPPPDPLPDDIEGPDEEE